MQTEQPVTSIARRTAYATGAQVAIMFAGLANATLSARLLGPSGRGVLVLAGLVTLTVSGLLSLGLGPALSYLIGKHRFDRPTLVLAAALWSLTLGGVSAALALGFREQLLATVLKGLTVTDLAWISAGLPAGFAILFMGAVLVGLGKIETLSILQSWGSLTNVLALAVAVALFGRDPHKVIVMTFFFANALAIAYWYVLGGARGAQARSVIAATKAAVPYGAKIMLGQIVALIYLRADSFFLNFYSGVAAVGLYSIAVTLAEKIWAFAGATTQSVYRDMTSREPEAAARLATRVGRLTLLFSISAALALVAITPLVPIVFGKSFTEAIPLLLILIPGVVLSSVGNVYRSFFMGQLGRPGTCSASYALTAVLAVALYVTLIPAYGVYGAAAASSIAYSASLIFWLVAFPRATGRSVREMLVPQRDDFVFFRDAAKSATAKLMAMWKRRVG